MGRSKAIQVTWWMSVILGTLGILANFIAIPVVSGYAFWLVVAGFLLLVGISYRSYS